MTSESNDFDLIVLGSGLSGKLTSFFSLDLNITSTIITEVEYKYPKYIIFDSEEFTIFKQLNIISPDLPFIRKVGLNLLNYNDLEVDTKFPYYYYIIETENLLKSLDTRISSSKVEFLHVDINSITQNSDNLIEIVGMRSNEKMTMSSKFIVCDLHGIEYPLLVKGSNIPKMNFISINLPFPSSKRKKSLNSVLNSILVVKTLNEALGIIKFFFEENFLYCEISGMTTKNVLYKELIEFLEKHFDSVEDLITKENLVYETFPSGILLSREYNERLLNVGKKGGFFDPIKRTFPSGALFSSVISMQFIKKQLMNLNVIDYKTFLRMKLLKDNNNRFYNFLWNT